MTEPRSFPDLDDHARLLMEELQVAQGSGYIQGPQPARPNEGYPKLPCFPNEGLASGSRNLAHQVREGTNDDVVRNLCHHIRFLEFELERLAAQVSDMAERLSLEKT